MSDMEDNPLRGYQSYFHWVKESLVKEATSVENVFCHGHYERCQKRVHDAKDGQKSVNLMSFLGIVRMLQVNR